MQNYSGILELVSMSSNVLRNALAKFQVLQDTPELQDYGAGL
jgi:hypothetical protein